MAYAKHLGAFKTLTEFSTERDSFLTLGSVLYYLTNGLILNNQQLDRNHISDDRQETTSRILTEMKACLDNIDGYRCIENDA